MRKVGKIAVAVVLAFVAALPGAADTLVQTFEDPTWDEDPSIPLAESIAKLREVHPYLVDVRGLDLIRTRRVHGYIGYGIDIVIPKGGFRGFGPYARLPRLVDEAWFRYYIYLDDFRPVSSGKLPGLADASRVSTAKGCKPSTESAAGWSARYMFDAVGTRGARPGEVPIGVYVYHLGQERDCGDEWIFTKALTQKRWTCIEGHVRMNTPGRANGLIEAWMDGERVFWKDGLAFRRPGENVGIREMWNNVYFGGSHPTPYRLGVLLDEIVVSATGRVGCADPFADDNHSVHAKALTELHARRLFFGCGERRACPDDDITRGQFAAMLHRVIQTPSGRNAFSDDNGHFAEKAINSLAQAGILRGCNPPANTAVCPDDPITRAQVAAMLRRTLGLPTGPNAFRDDDGHWAEKDINAIAAAGITRGCGSGKYCPDRRLTRGETASFLLRIHDQLAPVETLALPDVEWPPPGPPPPKPPEEEE